MTEKGLCECECGRKTSGVSRRFISGHNSKGSNHPNWKGGQKPIRSDGYVMIPLRGHPRANPQGYVYEHIIVAEKALGNPLPTGAVVHHVNSVRHDNRPENLVICPDQAYHFLLHRRQRALSSCGDPDALRCEYCKKYDTDVRQRGRHRYHTKCAAEYARNYREQKKRRIKI